MIKSQRVFKLWSGHKIASERNLGEITQKVWKQELSFLYATYCHDLFYITVKYHYYIPNGIQVMEWTQNCIWNHQGEITQKVRKREMSFLYRTHHHDLFYITVKYQDYNPKGIPVMERTQNWIWYNQGEITQKIWKQELSFMYGTYHHDLFYINVKFHDYIPKGIQVMEQTQNCIWNHQGEITQKVWKQELSFLYISSWPVLRNCEVSWLYSKGYSSYGADTKLHKKASKGR